MDSTFEPYQILIFDNCKNIIFNNKSPTFPDKISLNPEKLIESLFEPPNLTVIKPPDIFFDDNLDTEIASQNNQSNVNNTEDSDEKELNNYLIQPESFFSIDIETAKIDIVKLNTLFFYMSSTTQNSFLKYNGIIPYVLAYTFYLADQVDPYSIYSKFILQPTPLSMVSSIFKAFLDAFPMIEYLTLISENQTVLLSLGTHNLGTKQFLATISFFFDLIDHIGSEPFVIVPQESKKNAVFSFIGDLKMCLIFSIDFTDVILHSVVETIPKMITDLVQIFLPI